MLTIKHHVSAHCASICPISDGYLIAYYLRPECSNTQKIQLRYITLKHEPGCLPGWAAYKVQFQHTLYNKTGNCILTNKHPTSQHPNNKATIIYSYFNDTDGKKTPQNPVQRWMHCSNWIADIEVHTCLTNPRINVDNIKPLPTQPTTGFLVRINPIQINNQWILPIYHENPGYGQIMKSTDGKNWRTAGHIGLGHNKAIQPSLWWDGNILHSLSRDISGAHCAWHSYSLDQGESWADIQPTTITNHNNSIAVINDDNTDDPYVIWNEGERRNKLVLGQLNDIHNHKGKELIIQPIIQLNTRQNASYPNYYVEKDTIHIIHTEYDEIVHHIIDKQELNNKVIKRETIIIDENLQTRHL